MDIINLLAPYRAKPYTRSDAVKATVSNPGAEATPRLLEFTAKAPSTKTTATKNLSSGIPLRLLSQNGQFRCQNKNAQGESNRYTALLKKPNSKFARDVPSQAENRRHLFNENLKEKRAQRQNINRGISRDNLIMDRIAQKPESQLSQMEKLQRWKRERAELQKIQKQLTKPPMTAGLPPRKPNGVVDIPPKPVLTKATSLTKVGQVSEKERLKLVGILKKESGTVNSANSSSTSASGRTVVGEKEHDPNYVNIFIAKQTDKPPPRCNFPTTPVPKEMLHLFVPRELQGRENDENDNPPSTPKVAAVPPNIANSPAFKKSAMSPVKKTGGTHHSPAVKTGGVQHSPAIKKLSSMLLSPTVKKLKKPKGMQFDAVYIQFDAKFVSDSKSLSDYAERWTKVLEEDTSLGLIPEEIIGDIESSIGQAKLLLDSKLPQFAELLYFYLSRTANPHPVLACDLDGWWEVASISINKVKDRFVKLEKLSRNRWSSGTRTPLKPL